VSETTGIEWTDHTFNAWWGCTNVDAACDHCYAEGLDGRYHGGAHWGPGAARKIMSDDYWREPERWNRAAARAGVRRRVFAGSMCDVFDAEAPPGQLDRLWALIRSTPALDWQLLSKREGRIARSLPPDWGQGYPNVWIGVSVGDRAGLRRLDVLRQVPAARRFVSFEPLLEDLGPLDLAGIGWAIVGGESGAGRRPMDVAWLAGVVEQAKRAGVPVFVKQDAGPKPGKQGRIPAEIWALKEFPP